MVNETWQQWKPLEVAPKRYLLDCIIDVEEVLEIVLSDMEGNAKKIRIIFEGSVVAYRYTYETFRMHTLHMLKQRYGSDFYTKCDFFQVIDSEYLSWVSEQLHGVGDMASLKHFCLYGLEDVIDIIADCEPRVEFIDSK
ncbi:hypothetical protein IPF37_02285 [bacterium]|nr:MAG: hypothetical protein IPF37_02285 [bacterium]